MTDTLKTRDAVGVLTTSWSRSVVLKTEIYLHLYNESVCTSQRTQFAYYSQICRMIWIERVVVYCEDLMGHECSVWAECRVLRVTPVVGLHITHARL